MTESDEGLGINPKEIDSEEEKRKKVEEEFYRKIVLDSAKGAVAKIMEIGRPEETEWIIGKTKEFLEGLHQKEKGIISDQQWELLQYRYQGIPSPEGEGFKAIGNEKTLSKLTGMKSEEIRKFLTANRLRLNKYLNGHYTRIGSYPDEEYFS